VAHTAACLAGVLGVELTTLAERTTRNARTLFSIP
jgi:Tat protein secretion system quality control protein TatD with DNase activity